MLPNLSPLLNTPLAIGNTRIPTRLVLAPMTGLGHVAFREVLADFQGAGLMFSEMCSARSLPHENRHTSTVFRWRDAELPHLVCQLLGNDPVEMARAAERVEREGFFGVDINFGCSVAAVCKKQCGAALLRAPEWAAGLVAAVRRAVSLPLFVKYRVGWEDDPRHAVDLARRFEDAGADALTFHPRISPDRRSRPPKWDYIRLVKQAVGIPVFGNGNVFDADDCLRMMTATGCDGVALGRLAIAKPWVFGAWTFGHDPGPDTYLATVLKLADALEKHYEPTRAVRLFKKFVPYFAANFRFGHSIYKQLCRVETPADIRPRAEEVLARLPETIERPNVNLFMT